MLSLALNNWTQCQRRSRMFVPRGQSSLAACDQTSNLSFSVFFLLILLFLDVKLCLWAAESGWKSSSVFFGRRLKTRPMKWKSSVFWSVSWAHYCSCELKHLKRSVISIYTWMPRGASGLHLPSWALQKGGLRDRESLTEVKLHKHSAGRRSIFFPLKKGSSVLLARLATV